MDHVEQKRMLMDVSPGAPMHKMMKRFWLPIALSSDVTADGAPMPVRALGEDYVLFRDTNGTLGLLDELCTHRSASLCLGRNEGGGLRCLYHGWKYAVDGTLVEAPNVQDPRFKDRVKQPAYGVQEKGGLVWGYFGPADQQPELPHHPYFDLPEENRLAEIVVANANWSRTIEGLLDSSHTGVLHQDALKLLGTGKGPAPSFSGRARSSTGAVISKDLAPSIEVQETDFGLRYAALRSFTTPDGDSGTAARITTFSFPTTIAVPPDNLMQLMLPVDTERTNFFMVFWDEQRTINSGQARDEIFEYYGIDDTAKNKHGIGRAYKDLPDRPRRENNWLQDREAMREGKTFTGLYRFIPEDFAVGESMGRMEDFPVEHLVPADLAIARFRRNVIDNAKRVDRGEEPRGLAPKQPITAGYVELAEGHKWTEIYEGEASAK